MLEITINALAAKPITGAKKRCTNCDQRDRCDIDSKRISRTDPPRGLLPSLM
jgi:hypothetical protein